MGRETWCGFRLPLRTCAPALTCSGLRRELGHDPAQPCYDASHITHIIGLLDSAGSLRTSHQVTTTPSLCNTFLAKGRGALRVRCRVACHPDQPALCGALNTTVPAQLAAHAGNRSPSGGDVTRLYPCITHRVPDRRPGIYRGRPVKDVLAFFRTLVAGCIVAFASPVLDLFLR
jgi:hypothetical protein